MGEKTLYKTAVVFGLISVFLVSALSPLSFGSNVRTTDNEAIVKNDRYLYPEFYSCYNASERINREYFAYNSNFDNSESKEIDSGSTPQPLEGPMDSPWPMYCHDVRHTGRSSYSTIDTWDEIWRFKTSGWAMSSPSIDNDETIYMGAHNFYAVNLNGTLKWMYNTGGVIESCCPALDENGVIYVGTEYGYPNYLYAFYSDGTLKWKYPVSNVYTSPTITNDGTIIFADSDNWNIIALNPNGTQKWGYHTNMVIYSSPAIGLDGTIYCGSHDCNVYALYPNNGTLKWKFTTGNWVHGSPTIADDGTVYIGSDDGYLYALYPNNGTMKWKVNIGEVYGSPALDKDGTIYTGVWENSFYAIYPNGTIKWSFNTGAHVWDSSPALSDDGTLYFGTCDLEGTGGIEIIALYTDGTVKWRKSLDTVFSSPAIGSDGTVYIGSCAGDNGYLVAFGIGSLEADANGPYYGLINQPVQFKGSSSGGYLPYSYHWNFGDTYTSNEQNPMHTYTSAGNYTVTLTVTDSTGNTSSDTSWAWIQTTNTPPDKPTINGPTQGEYGISYDYKFKTTDPDGTDILWYYVDWGDGSNTGWIGPYNSNEEVTQSHFWYEVGTYIIKCKAKDPYDAESDWGTLQVSMPKNKIATNSFSLRLLERFPILEKLLSLIK